MPDTEMTQKTPSDMPGKHFKEPIMAITEEKSKCSDLLELPVIQTNNACNSKSTRTPEISTKEELKLDLPNTPTIITSLESLAFKKARLAMELKKVKIGKAKAKLRMAQIKKRDALRAKITRETREPGVNVSSTPGSRSSLSKDKTQENGVTTHARRLSPIGSKTVLSTESKRIADVTAFKMPTLIISEIGASGAPEKVRLLPPEVPVGSGDSERSIVKNRASNENLQTTDCTNAIESPLVVTNAEVINGTSSPLTSTELTNRRKLDLKLKKIRLQLQVKILEKTQAQKKKKVGLSKQGDFPSNHEISKLCFKKDISQLRESTAIENENYNLENPLEDNADQINAQAAKALPTTLPVDVGNCTHNKEKTRNEVCTDVKDYLRESSQKTDLQQLNYKEASMEPRRVLRKEEVMRKLLERQTILKENIDATREVNKELKYEKGVSDLARLVERQRKIMKYHGDKISENKSSLLKCSEQLIEEKKQIIASEKNLELLLKRKKVMESMVLSTTTNLIECRRKRGVVLKRLGEKKA